MVRDKLDLKQILVILLIVSSIFSHLLFLPKLAYKLQLTEIVFLILSLFFVYKTRFDSIRITGMDKSFIFFILILILNLTMHFDKSVLTDIIGFLYLVVLYFLLSKVLNSFNKEIKALILKYTADIGFWILIGIGILGFLLYYFLGYSKFVLIYHDYPYFGDVFRIKGFSYSPNLYISLLSFFIILKYSFSRLNFYHIFAVFTIALMSLTKETLILISILFAIELYRKLAYKKIALALVILSGLIYVILSFFIFTTKPVKNNIESRKVFTDNPVYQYNKLKIYPTTYFEVIKSGVKMTKENALAGVGLGNFRKKLKIYKQNGIYPQYFQTYDALDSYTGLASQLGIIYFVFLLSIIANIRKVVNQVPTNLRFPLILFLIYIFFESFALGNYHFRHYYIFLAILNSYD